MQMQAFEACGGDSFCLFDIAATGRMEVGLSTLAASQELEEISRPGKFNIQKVTLLKSMVNISVVFSMKNIRLQNCVVSTVDISYSLCLTCWIFQNRTT